MYLIDDGSAHEEVLATVVDQLCSEAIAATGSRWGGRLVLPSRESVLACMEGIRQVFFPGYFGATDLHDKSLHYYVGATLDHALHELEEQITRAVAFAAVPLPSISRLAAPPAMESTFTTRPFGMPCQVPVTTS